LYFDAVRLPENTRGLATLTEPEARFLLPFLPDREVYVNPIPMDLEKHCHRGAGIARSPTPLFVFVPTSRHPPNRDAARRLIERIAPLLHARLPAARLVLVGSELPPELA